MVSGVPLVDAFGDECCCAEASGFVASLGSSSSCSVMPLAVEPIEASFEAWKSSSSCEAWEPSSSCDMFVQAAVVQRSSMYCI